MSSRRSGSRQRKPAESHSASRGASNAVVVATSSKVESYNRFIINLLFIYVFHHPISSIMSLGDLLVHLA